MTEGEKKVWAAAYSLRFLSFVRDPMSHHVAHNQEPEDKEVFKKAAVAAIGDAFTAVDVLRSEAVLEEVRKTHVKESYYMFMEMRDQMDRVLG